MKKAKLILSAIAVFAVVGGALAFKAKSNFAGRVYYITTTVNGTATQTYGPAITTATDEGAFYYYTTTISGTPLLTGYLTLNS